MSEVGSKYISLIMVHLKYKQSIGVSYCHSILAGMEQLTLAGMKWAIQFQME